MQYKADGSFGEAFELNNFPFDTQAMTVKFTVACANQGLTPVRISTDRAASGRAGAPAGWVGCCAPKNDACSRSLRVFPPSLVLLPD